MKDVNKQMEYFNERVKPYHVKIRNTTTSAIATESTNVDAAESLLIKQTIYNHNVIQVDTTIGFDSNSYDGLYNSPIFMKNASYIAVYVDDVVVHVDNWVDGFWNGTAFSAVPGDFICNAIQLSASYGTDKDVWVMGYHATTVTYAMGDVSEVLWFGDGDNPDPSIRFMYNSNAVDAISSTGANLIYVEGFWDGSTFTEAPVDNICNAIKLTPEISNDIASFNVTLRVHFAIKKGLLAGNTLIYFTGDVNIAYDWPITNSPGPADFFYPMIEVLETVLSTNNSLVNLP